jgi:DNA-binding transcriptional LysR family regulator
MDWDDLRIVLAVARAGTALGGARDLGVNQTTVIRRIDQIETALGARLFERQRSGYRITELGQHVADTAARVEREVLGLAQRLDAEQRAMSGVVRFTSSESLASRLLPEFLPKFHDRRPSVVVQLITDDRRLDLAKGEADVALRAGSRPEGAGIVARRMPDVAWNLYCSRDYAARHGAPTRREEIADHAIVGMEGHMATLPGPLWLEASAPDTPIRFRSNSLTNLQSNLCAGLGLGMLPCFIGEVRPELMRCLPPIPELNSEMWIVVREDLRAMPHVRAFVDALADHIRTLKDWATGVI